MKIKLQFNLPRKYQNQYETDGNSPKKASKKSPKKSPLKSPKKSPLKSPIHQSPKFTMHDRPEFGGTTANKDMTTERLLYINSKASTTLPQRSPGSSASFGSLNRRRNSLADKKKYHQRKQSQPVSSATVGAYESSEESVQSLDYEEFRQNAPLVEFGDRSPPTENMVGAYDSSQQSAEPFNQEDEHNYQERKQSQPGTSAIGAYESSEESEESLDYEQFRQNAPFVETGNGPPPTENMVGHRGQGIWYRL